jgi:hypothetical protein
VSDATAAPEHAFNAERHQNRFEMVRPTPALRSNHEAARGLGSTPTHALSSAWAGAAILKPRGLAQGAREAHVHGLAAFAVAISP